MDNKYKNGEHYLIPEPISVMKMHPDAEPPSKENESDVCWDVTVVGRVDNRVDDTFGDINAFTTGLVLKAPKHCHLEIVEHPNLHTTGYSLAGSPIILNPGDDEEITIPLYKFRETADLELPYRAVRIVLRETQYTTLYSVPSKRGRNDDDDSYGSSRSRGKGGGKGSSNGGKKKGASAGPY